MATSEERVCDCGVKATFYEYKDSQANGTHYVFICEKTSALNEGPSYCPWCGSPLKSHGTDCKKATVQKKK